MPSGGPRPPAVCREGGSGARWVRVPPAGCQGHEPGAGMAPPGRGGAARRSPPGSPFSPPVPALRARLALSAPLALLPGFHLSATPLPAIGQVGASCGFGEEGGKSLEERGGGRREEGGGRRAQQPIWQIASCLPSPKCGAGARGSAAAAAAPPPPPNSGARLGLGPPPL